MPIPQFLPLETALLIIDTQKAIDDPSWGIRNNPDLERNIATVLAAWRARAMPIVHVRHLSEDPDSTYSPGGAGSEFKVEAVPLAGEIIIDKRGNSAFIGTDLEQRLRAAGWQTLVVAGVITNNSVETTVRMAGNLGFDVFVLADGTATFDRTDLTGAMHPAELVHQLSLANMHGEYATVLTTKEVLALLPGRA